MNHLESTLQAALLHTAPYAVPGLRLFRRNILKAKIRGRTMKAGISGQADLYGYWKGGVGGELELKAVAGSLSVEQREWRDFCVVWKIPHAVLRAKKNETVEQTVTRWCEELEAMRPYKKLFATWDALQANGAPEHMAAFARELAVLRGSIT